MWGDVLPEIGFYLNRDLWQITILNLHSWYVRLDYYMIKDLDLMGFKKGPGNNLKGLYIRGKFITQEFYLIELAAENGSNDELTMFTLH